MKIQKLKYIILAFGTVFLTSCTELLYTSLDVLRPAKVTFDANANNLLIVNNTVPQPKNSGHTIVSLNQKAKNISVETDSIPLFCLGALTEQLESNGFFSTVQIAPNSFNSSNNFANINTLSGDSVKKLCNIHHADVILSLDKIKVSDDISEYFSNETSLYLAAFEVRYESNWSIHYPNKTEVTPLLFKDTIYWESESYIRDDALNDLPKRLDGIIDGALNVGKKSLQKLLPYWDKVDRNFYNSKNKFIKRGIDSVYVKNWKSAIESWQNALNSNNTRTKFQAANNIAVAYEITGDIDKAIEYAAIAYNTYSGSYLFDYQTFNSLSEYLKELYNRKKDISILKKQLGE